MYKKQKLSNGIRLITIPMSATQTFTILVMAATGSRNETRENNGISHFLEHMMFKGTKKRPNTLAISSELDKVGGEFNAFTSKEYTGYYAKVDGQHAKIAIDVLGDVLLNSKFDKKEIEREKGVILEEMSMYENNPIIHIEDLFEECLYGDTPAGWDTIGTRENIKNFRRENFTEYFSLQYGGQNLVIALGGNFCNSDIINTKKLFSKILAGKGNMRYYQTSGQRKPQVKIKKQKTEQVNFSLGVRAFSYHHQDYYAAKLLGVILGGSMSSRLFIAVRERRGLAYQVHTSVEGYNDGGYLTTTVGTSADRVEEAIKTILNEYKKISRQLVGAAELKKAKDYICGKTTLHLESSDDMANWFARQEVLNQEILTPEQYFEKIKKVGAGDIRRIAREIFQNKNLNLAAIGSEIKEKNINKLLKI